MGPPDRVPHDVLCAVYGLACIPVVGPALHKSTRAAQLDTQCPLHAQDAELLLLLLLLLRPRPRPRQAVAAGY